MDIHPSVRLGKNVVIEGDVRIAENCTIGHHTVISGSVSIGANCRIGHHNVIEGQVEIGANNLIYHHCSIGALAQDPAFGEEVLSQGKVVIGSGNVFREFVTIHASSTSPATRIGDQCYIMAYCHIAHDVILKSYVKMANNATLAGFVQIDDWVYLGLHSVVHQHRFIGAHSMIGMNGVITKHVLPYSTIIDRKFTRINKYGLKQRSFTEIEIARIESFYNNLDRIKDQMPIGDAREIAMINDFLARIHKEESYLPLFV